MGVILVSDIFGLTPALLKLRDDIGGTEIIDPYSGIPLEFSNESEAYLYFTKNIGLESFTKNLNSRLKNLSDVQTFSIGASAIWKCAEENYDHNIKHAFGFYGSQIRNHIMIKPKFDVELIFPKNEPHFSVDELVIKLSQTKNVHISKSDFMHGFMNECSDNYSEKAYSFYVNLLLSKTS